MTEHICIKFCRRLEEKGMAKMISVIIPSYNEEKMIQRTFETVRNTLETASIDFELIFVNDGSRDGTWNAIRQVSDNDDRINGICFSRNFGKESAIYAGLYYAKGDCAVVIDCDLQHPPEKIVEMYRLWEQGYEVIEAVKTDRGKESFLHTISARLFYSLISKATHIDMSRASDFKLLDRKAILVLLNMKERNSFFRALSSWIGFKTIQVEFEVQERTEGVSKWSTWSLVKYAISNVTSFSTAPMQIVTFLGIVMFLVSVVMGLIAIIQKIMGQALGGFTTVILLQLFSSSLIMISLGIMGYYIAKIYEEIKGRPKFIVSETCGRKSDEKESTER